MFCRKYFLSFRVVLFLIFIAYTFFFTIKPAEASQAIDYTTFTETDPTSQITKTADCISFANIETKGPSAYVYKSYSSSGNFSYTFDTLLTGSDAASGETLVFGIADTSAQTWDYWNDGVFLAFYYSNAALTLKLGDLSTWDTSVALALGTRYYVRMSRSAAVVTARIYSDAGMTTLVDTLTKNFTNIAFSYVYGFTTQNWGQTGKKATGDSCHLVDENAGPSVPGQPVLNLPTAGDTVVNLSWNTVSGATGYKVKRGTTSGSYTVTTDVGNVTSYQAAGLTNGQTYYFVVSAYNGAGEGPNSNQQSATPQVGAPSAPTLNTPTAGDTVVNLSWNAVSGATSYKVKYGTSSGSYGTILPVGNVTSYQVTGLTNGTPYYFVVSAVNAGGESPNSNQQSATPQVPPVQTTFITNVDYNASGQITKIQFGNGNVTDYTYNSLNFRLTNIKTTNSLAQVIQDLSYQYDSGGNITSITDNVNTADQTFGYDALNRLTSANAPGTYGNKTYAYDTIGNITSKDGITYLYGENGDGPHAVTSGSDGSTFSYDANGNMLTMNKGGVSWAYIYDTENRLTEVKKNSQTQAQYEYDGDGGRTKKISYTWVGGNPTTETTRYVGSLYEESSSQITNHIFMGDSRIASITNGILKYYHTDHLGGTNLMTDSVGAVKQIVEYDPWGKTVRDTISGTPDQQAWHLFTSKQFDKESELYYYGARYYNPVIGRFIQPDPLVAYPTNPQSFNRYSYVHNNPINFVDPTGHFAWLAFFAKVGEVLAAVSKVATVISAATTVTGIATQNQDLLRIGQISGYIGLGTGLMSIGINSVVAAKAAASSETAAYIEVTIVDVSSGSSAQAASNAAIAASAKEVLGEAIKSTIGAFLSTGVATASMGGSTIASNVITSSAGFTSAFAGSGSSSGVGYWNERFELIRDKFYNTAINIVQDVGEFFTRDSYLYEQASSAFANQMAVDLGVVVTVESGSISKIVGMKLFGKMGIFNGGSPIARYFRVGFGRDGGERVFRAAGEFVERYVPQRFKTPDGKHIIFGRFGQL